MNPRSVSIDSGVQKFKCILGSTIDSLFLEHSHKHTAMTDQVSVRKLNRGEVCMLACTYNGAQKSETSGENISVFFIIKKN